ncbi:hypothetical protein MBRU_16205 [Mycolicibacterium brumae DSM 44177]|nr:hypothetical protein MBRU_16205 [Mycolicibacterium brumae DSM 44177]
MLVIAGAGQGKTEVVVSRIDHLTRYESLETNELLVLSFSRAAVSAVKKRLDLRDVPTPNVRTFDSFAGLLLLDADVEAVGSYEARVRRATRLLEESEEVPPAVELLQHIIIDEIQDLVGDRADFVLALMKRLDRAAGITALGDPLQGVYDFQIEESASKTSSKDVFGVLRSRFECEEVGLGANYRARGKYPKHVVAKAGALRRAYDAHDARKAEDIVDELMDDAPYLGAFDQWCGRVGSSDEKTTAVLCTTNADVLRVSRALNRQSVAHAVRRQAQDFGAARWIAGALGGLSGTKVWRSDVEGALARVLESEGVSQRWMDLKAAEGGSRSYDSLDLMRLRRVLEARNLALPLTEPDESSVIVSTIHRAKGLEFDRVFIIEPGWRPDDEGIWPRVCRDYVALSRARDSIYVCSAMESKSAVGPDKRRSGRFTEQKYGKRGRRYTSAIEFRYDDVYVTAPASSRKTNARDVQGLLLNADFVGSAVIARLDPASALSTTPSYLLYCDDQFIGRTSESFGVEFHHYFHWLRNRPKLIEGLSLASIETVAGDPAECEKVGAGRSGFWLVPRVTGLAEPDLSTT